MKRRAISGVVGVVLAAAIGGVSYFTGGELGGECKNDFSACKGAIFDWFGPLCLIDTQTQVGYCTIKCDGDAECADMGPGWGCRGSAIIDENNYETGETSNVCYSPQDIALMEGTGAVPQVAPVAPPPAEPAQ